MTQTIRRANRPARFTVISNAVMDDRRLSVGAIGLLVYLLHLPGDWNIQLGHLQSRFDIGRDKMQGLMRELRDAGYARLERVKGNDAGQFGGTVWIIDEEPGADPRPEPDDNRQPENPVVGGATDSRENRQPENPAVGKPGCHIQSNDSGQKTNSKQTLSGAGAHEREDLPSDGEVVGPPFLEFMTSWRFDEASGSINAAEREYDRLKPDEQAEAIRVAAALRSKTRKTVYAAVWLRERRWTMASAPPHPAPSPGAPGPALRIWIERGSPEWRAWETWHSVNGGATMARNADGTKRLIAMQRGDASGSWRATRWPPDDVASAA